MGYCTADDVAIYLGLDSPDVLLNAMTERAQSWIESHTRRLFEAGADTVHYFEAGRDSVGRTLYLDDDLCQITAIKTNLEYGSGGVLLVARDYTTEPRNKRLTMASSCPWEPPALALYPRSVKCISVKGRCPYL